MSSTNLFLEKDLCAQSWPTTKNYNTSIMNKFYSKKEQKTIYETIMPNHKKLYTFMLKMNVKQNEQKSVSNYEEMHIDLNYIFSIIIIHRMLRETNPRNSSSGPCPCKREQVPWSFCNHPNSQSIRNKRHQNRSPGFNIINLKYLQRRISLRLNQDHHH